MTEDGTSLSADSSVQTSAWTNALPAKNWLLNAQEEQEQKKGAAKQKAKAIADAKAKKEGALKLAKLEHASAGRDVNSPKNFTLRGPNF